MARFLAWLIAAACLCQTTGASAASPGCATILPGRWAIKGDYNEFGRKVGIDHRYVFKPDRSLETVFKTRGGDGVWKEQASTGKWSVEQNARRNMCVLTMSGSGGGETWGSFQTITIERKSRFKVHAYDGLYMRRLN